MFQPSAPHHHHHDDRHHHDQQRPPQLHVHTDLPPQSSDSPPYPPSSVYDDEHFELTYPDQSQGVIGPEHSYVYDNHASPYLQPSSPHHAQGSPDPIHVQHPQLYYDRHGTDIDDVQRDQLVYGQHHSGTQQQQQQQDLYDQGYESTSWYDATGDHAHYYADSSYVTHAEPHYVSHAPHSVSADLSDHPQFAQPQYEQVEQYPCHDQAYLSEDHPYASYQTQSQLVGTHQHHSQQYYTLSEAYPQVQMQYRNWDQVQYPQPPPQPQPQPQPQSPSPPPFQEESPEPEDERPMYFLEPPQDHVSPPPAPRMWMPKLQIQAPQPRHSPVSPPQPPSPPVLAPVPIAPPVSLPKTPPPAPRGPSRPLASLTPANASPSPIPRLSQRPRPRSHSHSHSPPTYSRSPPPPPRAHSPSPPLPRPPIVPSQSHLAPPRTSFRPFHPYPRFPPAPPAPEPIFGLFGSYPLSRGPRELPLPGPTCAPATSSSVMRLVLTPPFRRAPPPPDPQPAPPLQPPPKRPRMACFFCRKRKIACGPGPAAVRSANGGKDLSAFEDDGPCNQCARRGLDCDRPTESKRGVRKGKGKDRAEGDDAAGPTLELSPRASRGPTAQGSQDEYAEYDDDDGSGGSGGGDGKRDDEFGGPPAPSSH